MRALVAMNVFLLAAIAFVYVFSIKPQDAIVGYQSERSSIVFLLRVLMLPTCDRIDFETDPESPIGAVLNGYNSPSFDNKRTLRTADILLSKGCDIDQHGALGLNALHGSALWAEPDVTAYLLSRGADHSIEAIEGELVHYAGFSALEIAQQKHRALQKRGSEDGRHMREAASLRRVISILESAQESAAAADP